MKPTNKEINAAIKDYINSFNPLLSASEKLLVECSFKRGINFLASSVGTDIKRIPEQYDRRKKILKADIETIKCMYSKGHSIHSIAKHFNVHYLTIYGYLNPDYRDHQKEVVKQWKKEHKLTPEENRKKNAEHRHYKRQLSIKGLI